MMKLTKEHERMLSAAHARASARTDVPSNDWSLACWQGVADEYERIREEGLDGDVVERAAKLLMFEMLGESYQFQSPEDGWLKMDGDKGYWPQTYLKAARTVLTELRLGAVCGALEDDELERIATAFDEATTYGCPLEPDDVREAVNAVLASRRQRMVMSGRLERPTMCGSTMRLGAHEVSCGFRKDVDHRICEGVHTESGNRYSWANKKPMVADSFPPREGAKVAEHCPPPFQIDAATYELWEPKEPGPKMTLPEALRRVEHRRIESGKGLEAVALKELDRPLPGKPTHVATFDWYTGEDE